MFLDESDMYKIKREVKMYKIGKMIFEEGIKSASSDVEREISGKMIQKGKNQAKGRVCS